MPTRDLLKQPHLALSLVLCLGVAGLAALWFLAHTSALGRGDFIGYWSATYLLHNGQNPYDPAQMLAVQQSQVHAELDFVVMAWNPPPLFVFLLPLAWLSFDAAKATWLVCNLVMLLGCVLLLVQHYHLRARGAFLGFCLMALGFPQALIAITMGQVSFLVLLGLASSLFFIRRAQWFWAGAVLILAIVKFHMALLTVPYLLLYMAFRRRWQGWLGLGVAGLTCGAVLFLFRPLWLADYVALSAMAPVNWATPTVGGILSAWHVTDWGRYLIVLLFPMVWWGAHQSTLSLETVVALLTVLTVPTTFFGWSYDQSLLLIPMAQICYWLLEVAPQRSRRWLLPLIVVALLILWLQRLWGTEEVYYFWVPLFWGGVYALSWVPAPPPTTPVLVAQGTGE